VPGMEFVVTRCILTAAFVILFMLGIGTGRRAVWYCRLRFASRLSGITPEERRRELLRTASL